MIGEKMSADAIRNRIERAFNSIDTMYVGVISSIDTTRLKYNIRPVLNGYDTVTKASVESPVLFECPMMANKCRDFVIRIPYAVGDMVYVGICRDSLDEAMSSSVPHDNRSVGFARFRKIDGVILGGLLADDEPTLSTENPNDLLIQNRKTSCKMVMLEGGGFEFETSYDIKTKSGAFNIEADTISMKASSSVLIDSPTTTITGDIIGNSNINISGAGSIGSVTTSAGVTLDGHTHMYNPGPGAPSPTASGKG